MLEGSLKPDEVYSLTAFLLFKNGVIQEDAVLDQTTLPQVKCRIETDSLYLIEAWMPRPFPNGHRGCKGLIESSDKDELRFPG